MKKIETHLVEPTIHLDTQTVYHANGDVVIYPCLYELEKAPFTDSGTLSHRGRLTVNQDGTGRFNAYRSGSGNRYESLYHTESGELYKSARKMFVKLQLPADMGSARLVDNLYKQMGEICNFIKQNLN